MESPKRAKLEKLFSAEGIILEAQLAHILGRKQVSTVDDELASHEAPCTLPVQFAKGIPLGRDQRGIRDGAFLEEPLDDLQSRGKANVVGVWFEGEAEHGDALAFHHP